MVKKRVCQTKGKILVRQLRVFERKYGKLPTLLITMYLWGLAFSKFSDACFEVFGGKND